MIKARLGTGESSVLALALEHPDSEAVIDDLAARKCALSLSLPLRGTLGIVLVAKQRGAIPLARPVIESMLSAGLYLSRKVADAALDRVGEQPQSIETVTPSLSFTESEARDDRRRAGRWERRLASRRQRRNRRRKRPGRRRGLSRFFARYAMTPFRQT